MRRLTLLIFVGGLLACSEEEAPLTPNLVTEVGAYDLGNNGDASDIRVDFMVSNNLNVEEYRIMVIPAIGSASLDHGVPGPTLWTAKDHGAQSDKSPEPSYQR